MSKRRVSFRPRSASMVVALFALVIVAFSVGMVPASAAPALVTAASCAEDGGTFSVEAGVRSCTIVESYSIRSGPFSDSVVVQVDGPIVGLVWEYWGSVYTVLTSYERTTVQSQFGVDSVVTTTTDLQTGRTLEAGCIRRLREPVSGIWLGGEELDRPLQECIDAGVYAAFFAAGAGE